MRVVLVDYDSGNLHSAQKALARAGRDLGAEVIVSARPEDLARADRIVLPGDGAFPACRAALDAAEGMVEALDDAVRRKGKPFLGICVGMQLLADRGLEHRETPGLGWIGGTIAPITPADPALKVPHMGWSDLIIARPHPVLDGIAAGDHAYFVHSYRFEPKDPADLVASVDYGGPVTAIVARANIVGAQFHPEKSQEVGLRLIENFLRWRP
ncbi:MAG: imidazole glycerol phosphate synthase subunit HisH [Paracoccus sp. (in: a-proteobacteria)]|nr:imidazole glycerol phosphate synthase subunit HisH [Paracoccus sp. (in: a-proteobacteria)]